MLIRGIHHASLRSELILIINAMMAAGVVNLTGMMVGQIQSKSTPFEAGKYLILIMLLIFADAGFGAAAAVWMGSKRLFDESERLYLNRLES